jgi:hypothetical protein
MMGTLHGNILNLGGLRLRGKKEKRGGPWPCRKAMIPVKRRTYCSTAPTESSVIEGGRPNHK